MAEGPDENAPPQPILIHGGTPALETEALPNPWPSSVAQEGQSKVEVGSTQPYHGVSNETIQAYEIVLRDKPNTTSIGLLGVVFLFFVPFGFLYMADFDVLFNEGEELCCGSMLFGAVLLLLSFLQESAWNSRKKMAQNRALEPPKSTPPPRSPRLGVSSIAGAAASTSGYFLGASFRDVIPGSSTPRPALMERSMGEYLAAPALLGEPAVQQSFLSYFNT